VAWPATVPIQLPVDYIEEFQTLSTETESGVYDSRYIHAAPIARWRIRFSALSDAEADALTNFFIEQGGRYGEWEFLDPETGASHTKCRFGMDDLEIRRVSRNENACDVLIEEYA
jgi:hypothetical protein